MMRSAKLIAMVSGLVVALAGCSGTLIESKKIDYKSAGRLPSLEIPPDLTSPSSDDRYAVPAAESKGTTTYSAYSGERSASKVDLQNEVLPQIKNMRIVRDGSERWLVVKGTPQQLWPIVKQFWEELGFIINVDMPDAGIMETDWAENRANIPQDPIRSFLGKALDQLYSTPYRDKFRTRLEPGTQPGTTDIFITHRGMEEIYPDEAKDRTVWQPRPPDPGLEAEMLRRLMVRLGASKAQAKAMVAEAPAVQRATMQRGPDGSGTLQVQDNFERAWRRVGLALDRVGFTVEDRDRSKGLYYVRYVNPDEDNGSKDEGFLSKLMFWRSSKPKSTASERYRIYVKGDGNISTVEVLSREGGADTSGTAKKILSLLFDQLK